MEFKLWTAPVRGNAKNSFYPNEVEVKSLDDFKQAAVFDHVAAKYKNNHRSKENFLSSNCIVMDCDNDQSENPAQWVTAEVIKNSFPGVSMVIAPSRNFMKAKGGKSARPRYHVYFPIEPIEKAEDYADLKQKILLAFPQFDGNAVDAARFLFGCDVSDAIWVEGDMPLEGFIGFDYLGMNDEIPEGSRNSTMSHFAGKVLMRFGNTPKARKLFFEKAAKCDPPLPGEELQSIWSSAKKFAAKIAKQADYVPPEEYQNKSLKPTDYSDSGEAEVLARVYKDKLVYTPATGFLKYNGMVWEESEERAVEAVQKLAVKQLAEAYELQMDALESGNKDKIDMAKSYVKFAIKRRDIRCLKSALAAAQPMVDIKVDQLDSDGFLLNTPAGIYDLTKGLKGLMPHDSKKHLTKITAVAPSENGCAIWRKALKTFFCNDEELMEYVQCVAGLAAVGKVYVESLVIAYGDGRNGKSTFWNTLAKVMGSYTGYLSADTLTTSCNRNVKPEMAEIKGRRLVIAAELNEGTRLNTSLVKQLCSTDKIFAEKKYHAPFAFTPSHTVVLYTNHLPSVTGNDKGTWRRLLLIPFNAVIEGKDDIKNYSDYLYEHCAGAILTWIIEGAKKAYDAGFHLDKPQCVEEALNGYKDDNDWLGRFISANCEVDKSFYEKSGELYKAYHDYARAIGEWPKGSAAFYSGLTSKGFGRKRDQVGRYVLGLRLKCTDFIKS